MKQFKVALVGATGLVGRTAIKVLSEKKLYNLVFPVYRVYYV